MFTISFINCCAIFNDMVLIAVKQEVKRIDNSVVVHELELAIKRYIYRVVCEVLVTSIT